MFGDGGRSTKILVVGGRLICEDQNHYANMLM